MRWLGEQLGMERLTRCEVILPTDEYFPDAYDATPEAAGRLLDRVCGYMQVNRAEIDLQIHSKDDMPGAAGTYEPGVIHVADARLDDPMALVATLAHELAYHILIGRGLLEGEPDSGLTTDLTTVYFGLGIFWANATVSESHGHGQRTKRSEKARLSALASDGLRHGACTPGFAATRSPIGSATCGPMRPRRSAKDCVTSNAPKTRCCGPTIFGDPMRLRLADCSISWSKARRPPVSRRCGNLRGGQARPTRPCRRLSIALPMHGRAFVPRPLAPWPNSAHRPTDAIQALVYALDDSEEEVRAAAAFALGKLHLQPEIGDRTADRSA